MTSLMEREIGECAATVRGALLRRDVIAATARALGTDRAKLAVVCGRGSSGHAAVHLRYLVETRLGLPVSATAPSVFTSLDRALRLDGTPFIVVSQSGRSPDLVVATEAARKAGARTLAIVNDPDSPVARAAGAVLAIGAGPELSVAATKSVVGSMAVGALLVASLAGDAELDAALERLPARLDAALALDWGALPPAWAGARCAFVTSRGFGLGPAREVALKMAETLRLPALAYSSAELLHGPRAALGPDTPVLALRLADATAASVDATVADLRGAGQAVQVCGGPAGDLPWLGDDHPVADAIAMLVPAYRAIERAARAAGFDPDRPPHLKKVTETL
jgi:glucosamine--fructose-6-phosphate aminotransferase (isomerizing)